MPLLALFLAVPVIEIALFIVVGGWISLWPTLGLILLTALVGSFLVRRQGLAVIGQLQGAVGRNGNPLAPLGHGALILLAGLLLITPGFLTDAVGFALLVPGFRSAILKGLAARVVVVPSSAGRTGPVDADVIDGDYREIDPEAPRVPSGWTRPPNH